MTRYLRYLVPLAIFIVLVAFLYRGLSLDPKRVPSPLVGKPMPEFSLPRLKDPTATTQRHRPQGQGLHPEYLGHLVRLLPRRTRGVTAAGKDRQGRYLRPELQG